MDWTPGGRSSDLEDRRGDSGGFGFGGGLGIGGFVIILLLSLVFHRNLFTLLGSSDGGSASTTTARPVNDPAEEPEVQFVSFVLGDDRLQRMAGRNVSPESFTHGSSDQRMHWFQQGFASGDINSCNTFAH